MVPLAAMPQGSVDIPMSPELAEARQSWLNGRYEGIWEVVEREAQAGHPAAQNMLGASYTEQDGSRGKPYDPQAGYDWYRKAADRSFARAFHNLAIFWQEDHDGFGTDYAKSRARAEDAIALGYVHSNTVIGDLYKNGRGVEKDATQALEFYRRAADGGSFEGLRLTAYAYLNGEGVEKDIGLGTVYLERAIAAGDRRGIRDLAWLYEGNEGVEQDLVKSYLLYRYGIERGMADAAYELALFAAYEEYEGFWHDPVQGYGYCLLALDWGFTLEDGDAAEECESIAESFDDEQRSRAQAFADSLK